MKPADIGKAYDQITHLWTNESFDITNGVDAHKTAFQFVKHYGKALDIGCGCTGRFIDLLTEQGFTPSGLDISSKKLAIAKQRHPDVEFIEADVCEYELVQQYDFITAWDSIWHIPLAQQTKVLTKIVNALNQGGVFIFSFGGTAESGEHTDSFMGPQVYYSSLGTNGFLSLFIELGCQIRHVEFDQYPEFHTFMVVEKVA
ncbi:class I SAM-dependent methyltransferase [Vibrio tapetis]|uniref:Type 11 methyltransferase n=1 Tax=Vibrio tapetis subsp. tapetis TaxID=1671868 RepID=A0A2N8ZAJ3_9VIBR|nr:class I SAM-dependent methyltransferase [Vibrio tapetis]SON48920.1 Type 11 methyltransferase [Vibrio tapetis subsp. tapetis]